MVECHKNSHDSSHYYTFGIDFAAPPIKRQDCFSIPWLWACPVICFGQCAISNKMKSKTEMWLQWSLSSLAALGKLRLPWKDARASLLNDEKYMAQALSLLWSTACQPPALWTSHTRSSNHQPTCQLTARACELIRDQPSWSRPEDPPSLLTELWLP